MDTGEIKKQPIVSSDQSQFSDEPAVPTCASNQVQCISCGLNKASSEFYYHDREKKRLKQRCKDCERAVRRERNAKKYAEIPPTSDEVAEHLTRTVSEDSTPLVFLDEFDVFAKAFEILLGIDQRLRRGTP